jgi:replication factor C subunit 2/4
MAREMDTEVIVLNVSDERGLAVVRQKISAFSQKSIPRLKGRIRIVVLDEADNMTESSQRALRRLMDVHEDKVKFVYICNVSGKIIEPIQSRCSIFRFSCLSEMDILRRISVVIEKEGISRFDDEGLEAILKTSQGDMRYALNNLQSTWEGLGAVTHEKVCQVVDQPSPVEISRIIQSCLYKKLKEALTSITGLYTKGYTAMDITQTMLSSTRTMMDMDATDKRKFIKEIGLTCMRLDDGMDSLIQHHGLISRLCTK